MKRLAQLFIVIYMISTLTGCATVEHMTLPASKEDSYTFPAYIVYPPQSKDWRFINKYYELQGLIFLHTGYKANLFFWITPILMDMPDDEREESIIDYFQKKELKKFKLSPDVRLTETSINRSKVTIDKKTFNMISVAYEMEKKKYTVNIYYHVSEEANILYSIAVLTPLFNQIEVGWEDNLRADVQGIIANMVFLSPEEKDMQELRVTYAHSDFVESAKDKYLKEKVPKVREKFTIAIKEAKQWLVIKPDSYKAYEYLGLLAAYNNKFERYGEGFNSEEVEKQLMKSLEIRSYYKSARLNLAKLFEITDRKEDAIKTYEFATTLSPNDEDLYYKLGQLYEDREERDKAREYYEKAIRYWSSGFITRDELKKKLKNWDSQ